VVPFTCAILLLVEQPTKKELRPLEKRNSRAAIIDGAYQVLAQQGYEAASIKEIARAAAVAPGLVHYYFKSKEELLVAVLAEASARYTRQMATMAETPADAGWSAPGLAEPKRRVAEQPEWYRLRYELFALGLRNPAILPGVAALLANGREGVAATTTRLAGAELPDATAVGAILLACFDGLALQKLADPAFDLEAAYRVLARMAPALFGQGKA
jgi:AcrR family transcriptional regulator